MAISSYNFLLFRS